jgi:uncharacterized protein with PQ loop repeat
MAEQKYQILAGVAGLFTITAFSHLIYRVYNTKQTEHLTYMWIFLVLTAQLLLTIYGLLNHAYGIYIPSMLALLGIGYIFFVKLTNTLDNKIEMDLINKNILNN